MGRLGSAAGQAGSPAPFGVSARHDTGPIGRHHVRNPPVPRSPGQRLRIQTPERIADVRAMSGEPLAARIVGAARRGRVRPPIGEHRLAAARRPLTRPEEARGAGLHQPRPVRLRRLERPWAPVAARRVSQGRERVMAAGDDALERSSGQRPYRKEPGRRPALHPRLGDGHAPGIPAKAAILSRTSAARRSGERAVVTRRATAGCAAELGRGEKAEQADAVVGRDPRHAFPDQPLARILRVRPVPPTSRCRNTTTGWRSPGFGPASVPAPPADATAARRS